MWITCKINVQFKTENEIKKIYVALTDFRFSPLLHRLQLTVDDPWCVLSRIVSVGFNAILRQTKLHTSVVCMCVCVHVIWSENSDCLTFLYHKHYGIEHGNDYMLTSSHNMQFGRADRRFVSVSVCCRWRCCCGGVAYIHCGDIIVIHEKSIHLPLELLNWKTVWLCFF